MKFSVIIPSFQQGKYIKQTIDSILSQERNDTSIEVIVIDGGSTDETIEILKSYGDKIYWISEKDNGQTHAINKGLKIATGEIFSYLNSDDFYFPHTLKKVEKFFLNHPSAFCVTGDAIIVDENGKEIQGLVRKYKGFLRNLNIPFLLYITNYIVQPSTFWKREVLTEIGFFNENKRYTMDYDYWLKIIKKYKIYNIKDPLSAFRIHKSSKGGSQYKKQFEEDYITLKENCNSRILRFFHLIHNFLIKFVYSFIK